MMLSRSGVARASMLAALCLAISCASACGGDKAARGSTEAGAERDVAADDGALAASREQFLLLDTYRIEYEVTSRGFPGKFEGEGGYRSGDTVYGRTRITGTTIDDDETGELLFLPPDLYMQQGSGDWIVLSPWNQGTRPDEPAELYLQDPLIDYVSVTDDLREIEYHGQEKKGDHNAHRYEGIVDETDLGALGHDGGRGDIAEVTLWIDTTSLLPVRFEARVRYDRIVVEFLDYDLAVVAPDAPADARPFRDVQLPDAACIGSAFKDCLPAQAEISGSASCAGTGKRVCLVPLGQISAALVQHLVDTYRDDYDLDVTVLTATAIPPALADPQRQQVDADRLIEYMGGVFPDEYRDPQVTLIGVTIVDLYDSTSHFRYVFGVKGTPADPKAVVSNFRMDPATYSEPRDDELLFARTRKLVSKYIGLLYYELPASADPSSPMYDSILGPADLDRMKERLPVK